MLRFIVFVVVIVFIIKKLTAKPADTEPQEEAPQPGKADDVFQKTIEAHKRVDETRKRLAEAERRLAAFEAGSRAKAAQRPLTATASLSALAFDRQLRGIPREPVLVLSGAEPLVGSACPWVTFSRFGEAAALDDLGRFIALDVETSGLEPEENEILQIAAVRFDNFEPVGCFVSYVRPRKGISLAASAVNGITEAAVADAPYPEEIAGGFRAFLGEELPLVGHNLKFDLSFLCASGCWNFQPERRYYDTLKLSYALGVPGSHKLDDLGKSRLRICRDDAHDALSDAFLTGLLIKDFRDMFRARCRRTM